MYLFALTRNVIKHKYTGKVVLDLLTHIKYSLQSFKVVFGIPRGNFCTNHDMGIWITNLSMF